MLLLQSSVGRPEGRIVGVAGSGAGVKSLLSLLLYSAGRL
jgi:hypothetical protein